jgi:hypothetical protein
MTDPIALTNRCDELARQRRKREARLLEQQVVEFPAMTLADVVADVLAACDQSHDVLDVRGYLATEGYGGPTVEAVIGYLHRQYLPEPLASPVRPLS